MTRARTTTAAHRADDRCAGRTTACGCFPGSGSGICRRVLGRWQRMRTAEARAAQSQTCDQRTQPQNERCRRSRMSRLCQLVPSHEQECGYASGVPSGRMLCARTREHYRQPGNERASDVRSRTQQRGPPRAEAATRGAACLQPVAGRRRSLQLVVRELSRSVACVRPAAQTPRMATASR
jgi:hypothetical protein